MMLKLPVEETMMSISDTTVSTPAGRRRDTFGNVAWMAGAGGSVASLPFELQVGNRYFLIELFRHEVGTLMDRKTPCEKVAGLECFMSWLTSNMHMG